MTQTLRRERIQKFTQMVLEKYYLKKGDYTDEQVEHARAFCELLADASISASERKTDEEPGEYNAELFRGDWRDYPENLWKIAEALRDVWMFRLPAKPHKKNDKGQYAFYIQSMAAIKDACAEFGDSVLVKVHVDWKAKFKDGIAPYTVAQPTSLINVCAGKARELREAGEVAQSREDGKSSGYYA